MITILMAAYRGSPYLAAQLESLLAQTVQDFTVWINDDGSDDNTVEIARDYALRYPGRFRVTSSAEPSGSAKRNFMSMMTQARDDYLMLCDQDDVWLPDKVEISLAAMRAAETRFGQETPLVVHTDLKVVDADLNVRYPSYFSMMNANPDRTALRDEVVQNTLTGCTAMYNRALAQRLAAVPDDFVMHDWWIMLVAAAFGRIVPLRQATMLYRQHGDNVVGAAQAVRTPGFVLEKILHGGGVREALYGSCRQAGAFEKTYGDALDPQQRELLQAYAHIPNMSKPARVRAIFRLKTWKNGFARRTAQLIYI
ncbi:MAG: glycosyltransferase family 2 protein [Eubacteriales bacterium]|nr:glycosyltransferase family 2 protein [Eubacteriales bacterium]